MKCIQKIIAFIILCCLFEPTVAQVTISGEVRPRAEFRNGFKRLDSETTDPAFFIEQRSRLNFSYKEAKYALKIVLQDVRIWGQTSTIYKTENNLTSVNEAWGQYYFSSKWSAKIGRQIISYDNQRFLGGLEWAQQGRRHDAVLLQYQDTTSNWDVHIGLAFNQSADIPEPAKIFGTSYTTVNNYKTMQYIWAHKETDTGKYSFLVFNEGNQYGVTDSISYRQTIGFVGKQRLGKIQLAAEAYLQSGAFAGTSVQAGMYDLNLTLPISKQNKLVLGYQYLSGNNNEDSDFQAFTPAYGTNHAHNGYMDYFFVGNGHGNAGLQDIYIKAKWKLSEKGTLQTNFHQFASAIDLNNDAGALLRRNLGTEIDVVYMVKLANDVTFHLGYSQLFATEALESLKGGDRQSIQNWAWTMITFKPAFYKTPKK